MKSLKFHFSRNGDLTFSCWFIDRSKVILKAGLLLLATTLPAWLSVNDQTLVSTSFLHVLSTNFWLKMF